MLGILFLIGGVVIFTKGEVKISAKRKITGNKAKTIGLLLIFAPLLGILSRVTNIPFFSLLGLVLYGAVILLAIYYVFFVKGEVVENK
jgi:hypothetical protein